MVTGVEITSDLRTAKVHVSVLGDDDQVKSTITALNEARPDLRHEIGDIVVRRAKSKASALGLHQQRAAATLRSAKQAARAVVTLGRERLPYGMGAEFGAIRGEPRGVNRPTRPPWNQFLPWWAKGNTGYFLFPAIRDTRNEITDLYMKRLDEITKPAFPE
jgi:hypothetical protein